MPQYQVRIQPAIQSSEVDIKGGHVWRRLGGRPGDGTAQSGDLGLLEHRGAVRRRCLGAPRAQPVQFADRLLAQGRGPTGARRGDLGPLLALSLAISVPIALTTDTWLPEHMSKRGHLDAMVRVCFLTLALSAPFSFAGPLMPDPYPVLACGRLASMFGLMGAPAQNAAVQMVTPNEMRATVSALYLLTISVVGTGINPLVIALTTDYGFGDEGYLRYSMALAAAVLAPGRAFLMYLARKPFARAVEDARGNRDRSSPG